MTPMIATLRANRRAMWEEARALVDGAEAVNRSLTSAESAAFDATTEKINRLDENLKRLEATETRSREIDRVRPAAFVGASSDGTSRPWDVSRPSLNRAPVDFRELGQAMFGDFMEKRATYGYTTGGTAIVQPEYSRQIWDFLAAQSVVLKSGVTTVVMASQANRYIIPSGTADPAGAWLAEAATATPTDPGLTTVQVVPSKLMSLGLYSNEILEDSAYDARGWAAEKMTRALALKLDLAIMEGSGTPPEPQGWKNVSNISTIARGGSAFHDLSPFAAALGSAFAANTDVTDWFVNPRVAQQLLALQVGPSTAALNIAPLIGYTPTLDGSSPTAMRVFGRPVHVSSQIADTGGTATSVYGVNAPQTVVVRREDFAFEVDPYGMFDSYVTRFRVVGRFGVAVPNPKSVVAMTGIGTA